MIVGRRSMSPMPAALSASFRACCRPRPKAVIGFWPANTVDDDIRLFTDDNRVQELATLFTLRQQLAKRDGRANVALADFVAPTASGRQDYVGGFVVTAGIEEVAIAERF